MKMTHLPLIDTHAHLYLCTTAIEEIIDAAQKGGVTRIINPGINIESSIQAFKLYQKFPDMIIPAIGIHPSEADHFDQLDQLEHMLTKYQFKIIGETGLDFYKSYYAPKNTQIASFQKHLQLADKYKLPIIIHNRHSDQDMLNIIKKYDYLPKVFHCYSSNKDFAEMLINPHTYFSFTGSITYAKKGKVIAAIRYLPLSNILLETDTPYLTPNKYKEKENQPAYVIEVAKKIAEVKDCSLEEVIEKTTLNAIRLFNL